MTFSSMNMVYFSIYLGALQFLSMMCCKYTSKCLIWFIYSWVVCFWVMVNRIILLILFSIIHCYSTKVLLILVYWSYILQICWTHLLACFFFFFNGFLSIFFLRMDNLNWSIFRFTDFSFLPAQIFCRSPLLNFSLQILDFSIPEFLFGSLKK